MNSNFVQPKKKRNKKTKEQKDKEIKEKEERKNEKENKERIDKKMKKTLNNIIRYVIITKKIKINIDNSDNLILEKVSLIASNHVNIKREIFIIEKNKDNLTEDRKQQIEEILNIYTDAIKQLKKSLFAFSRLDQGFKDILGIGIIEALQDIIIIDQCTSHTNVNMIIPECHDDMTNSYMCVCGKDHLHNLLICDHPNLPEFENMIIGSVCTQHFKIFALLQSCEENRKNFLKIYEYAKSTKYKLTKKKCSICDCYNVRLSNNFTGEEKIKNTICSKCYKVHKCNNGTTTYKTKCLSCDVFIHHSIDKCKRCIKKFIYNFV